MNIGNIVSNNFNLDSNGKDMQIEVYEQLIEQLQQENKQLKTQINEYQKALDETMSEKIDIEDNWNKLKEYIKNEIPEDVFIDTEWFVAILDKMQEIEQGSDSNVKD